MPHGPPVMAKTDLWFWLNIFNICFGLDIFNICMSFIVIHYNLSIFESDRAAADVPKLTV